MSDLILHHYALSPFSEKVRAMLGYAGLDWQSVTVREMPPRPQLAPLAGGYRKIPVAQSGADVFCDTRIIGAEIAALAGKPELVASNAGVDVQDFVARVDLDIFLACIISAGNMTLLRKVLKESSLLDLGRLLWDRIAMGSKAKVKTNSPKQMKRMVEAHLTDLEGKLESHPFLFGDTPTAADAAVAPVLDMIVTLPVATDLRKAAEARAALAAYVAGVREAIYPDPARVMSAFSAAAE